jgi:hypothetical protein
LIAVDETLERRKGKKIKAKGVYRDAVRSSQSKVITAFGLKWECMTLIVPLPWCRRPWALPFLTVLSPSKKNRMKKRVDDTKHRFKTPDGKNVAETFFRTGINNEPVQIINRFILRWNIEVTFEETRAHLGVETQRQWSDKAIQRSTPLLMGLYSVLTLIAIQMHEAKRMLIAETTSWYDKNGEFTFADIIVSIRRSIWSARYFSKSENKRDLVEITELDAQSVLYQLALAA